MTRTLFLLPALFAAFATPTFAGAAPVNYSWTGFYAGAAAGVNTNTSDVSIPLYPSNFSVNTTSLIAGGKVGYNYQAGNLVFGAEGEMDGTFNKGHHATGVNVGGSPEQYQVEQNWSSAIVGKAGVAPIDGLLIYGKGGLAFANMNNLQFIPVTNGTRSSTDTGWTAGAGADFAMTDNWILGVDYAHADYGHNSFFYAGPVSVSPKTDAVKASISYKFY